MAVFPREQLLKICRMIGRVRFAGRRKTNSPPNNVPIPNQSAICVDIVVGFLNVLSYTPAEPPPCRLDIIFDLKPEKSIAMSLGVTEI
jgi:hypothetical protein